MIYPNQITGQTCAHNFEELFINLIGGILFIAIGAIAVQNYTYQGEYSTVYICLDC
jgi:hypothetical protein